MPRVLHIVFLTYKIRAIKITKKYPLTPSCTTYNLP